MLGKQPSLKDLESMDLDYYKSLCWILENDITDVIDETFTTTEERFGEMVTVELKPGGGDIPVTEENKKDYVSCVVEYRISKRVKEQFDAFMSGFSELIPQDLINVFDERELELLIGGMSEIDVYVECLFLFVIRVLTHLCTLATTGASSRITVVMKLTMKSCSGSGSVSAAGLQNANLVCCSSRRVLPVSLSTGLKIFRGPMGRDGSPSRSLETQANFRRVTPASIGLIYRHTRTTTR